MFEQEDRRKKQERYFAEFCFLMKAKDGLLPVQGESKLNRTELRLISEVISTQYEGGHVISTQLAKRIGVTRSAVSQMVARLEEQGVLRRVDAPNDRKIAYVEIADGALQKYGEELNRALEVMEEIVTQFGEENFEQMCALFRGFVDVVEGKVDEWNQEVKANK